MKRRRASDDIEGPVLVAPARYVRLGAVASACTGITKRAMERKIESREWEKGREWIIGPDGRRYLDLRGYEAWVERASCSTS